MTSTIDPPSHAPAPPGDASARAGASPAAPGHGRPTPPWVGFFVGLGVFLLLGYAIGDRGFAYIKPPGPIFLSEILLGLAVCFLLTRPDALRRVFSANPAFAPLVAFLVFGVVRLVPFVPTYGLDAIRDFALVYYAVFAFAFAALFLATPQLIARGLGIYAWFLPVILFWLPFGAVLARRSDLLVLPAGVSLFNSKSGNTAVHAVLGLGFVLYFGRHYYSALTRQVLSALAFTGLLFAVSQARGGLMGAAIALTIMVVFLGRFRARAIVSTIVVFSLAFTALYISGVSITTNRREVSAEQLLANATSVLQGGESEVGNLGSTAEWREYVWTSVIKDVTTRGQTLAGVGFGRNMGDEFLPWGVPKDRRLRNPHNSHLDVWVRMGWFGFLAWAMTWVTWFGTVGWFAVRRLRTPSTSSRLAALALAGNAGILVNAIVDPTFEGPQVAIWAWFLFALGAVAAAAWQPIDRLQLTPFDGFPRRRHTPGAAP